jgi:tetraacyldisaccharide 4'-kinase
VPQKVPPDVPLIILASRSPRRAQLLREAGYRFVQMDPPFDDPPQPHHGDAERITTELAVKKAESLRKTGVLDTHPGAVILAADTACVGADGQLYGQPRTRAEAEAMIREFVRRPHGVVTGVALAVANANQIHRFAAATGVSFGAIDDRALEYYLASEEWRGKAGGYNLFDRQSAGWPIRVVGDPTNVVGLPMGELRFHLRMILDHQLNVVASAPLPFRDGTRFERIISGEDRSLAGIYGRTLFRTLEPFYAFGVGVRNRLLDRGFPPPVRLPRPVISVGNLTTGGTGKTPTVIEIARRVIRRGGRPAILLRGYRSGDETYVLRDALGDLAAVEPDPDRIAAAERVMARDPAVTVFILDDGFQHRRVDRDLDLVLVDATRPWGYGHLLPRGLLREPKRNLCRADAVIVTRAVAPTPELDREIAQLSGRPPVAHAAPVWSRWRVAESPIADARPGDAEAGPEAMKRLRVYAICGIGNPTAFEHQLRQHVGELVGFRAWRDHHDFSIDDVWAIRDAAANADADAIAMTEKDWVKLRTLWRFLAKARPGDGSAPAAPAALPVYRPVLELAFLDGSDALDALLARVLERHPTVAA